MLRCIAIDDEPLALRQIKNYIERNSQLSLAESFSNAIDAQEWLANNSVDVIFVDINMPELSGVDFVRSLENGPMVIFTTAYSEYAVEGFRLEAIDYLLKPFSYGDFEHAVNRAASLFELVQLKEHKSVTEQSVEEENATSNKEFISIRADHKTSLIRLSNIIYMESEGEYVRMYLSDGTKIVTLFRLKNMENTLPSSTFMRIHRSYIVNLDYVTGYTKGRVFLSNNEYVPIGENYKEAFMAVARERF